jgi:SAM-dependent methyltransferase
MLQDSRYTEDLPRLAADAYEVSGRLCGSCRDLHALWPYIRLARASTGVEARPSALEGRIANLLAHGGRHVLIAGSADSGILALVARAAPDRGANIAVLDICETPLELCRRFAARWSLPIETIRQDLRDLQIERRFDIVLVHGTLHFISADRRLDVLKRLQRAIRPGGRLVLLFNTGHAVADEFARESRIGYASWVADELNRLNVPLPESEPDFRARLEAHARRREAREGAFAQPGEVEALLEAAGFNIDHCSEIGVKLARPVESFIAKISKRRFLAVAEPIIQPTRT